MRAKAIERSHGVILCFNGYDVDEDDVKLSANQSITDFNTQSDKAEDMLVKVLASTKSDLYEYSSLYGTELASDAGYDEFFPVSARTGDLIDEMFFYIAY